MATFASEKRAVGDCDRCGFTRPLKTLRAITIRMKKVNLRVCPECWEADHPQYKLGTFKIEDPQALQNPRPALNNDRTLIPNTQLPRISDARSVNGAALNVNLIG